jgi:hypothetical protein
MGNVLAFIKGLFASKKLNGVDALTMALANMAKVVDDLDNTLMEADIEAELANDRVVAAENEWKRVTVTIDKGRVFLTGLKALFGN